MISESELRIYETQDYSIFKALDGNREIRSYRVSKIADSIKSVGYIPNPIIVNEKYEVIDGQNRLDALKKLEMPIQYIKVSGIGINECMAMNIYQTNWSMTDYILSYAKQGNENYRRLAQLANEFPEFSYQVIVSSCVGFSAGGSIKDIISKGDFVLSQEHMVVVRSRLAYISKFAPYSSKLKGRKCDFYSAVIWCWNHVKFDKERLVQKFAENCDQLPPIANIQTALECIESIYNRALIKSSRVYFRAEYDRKT